MNNSIDIENLLTEKELSDLRSLCWKKVQFAGDEVFSHLLIRGLTALQKGNFDQSKGSFGAYLYGIIDSAVEDYLKENGFRKTIKVDWRKIKDDIDDDCVIEDDYNTNDWQSFKENYPDVFEKLKTGKTIRTGWKKIEVSYDDINDDCIMRNDYNTNDWQSFEKKYPDAFEKLETAIENVRKKIKKDRILSEIFERVILGAKDVKYQDICRRGVGKTSYIYTCKKKLISMLTKEVSKVFGMKVPESLVKEYVNAKEKQKNKNNDLSIKPRTVQMALL
ncbi:MAG: hypothetical protein QW561_00610 [Candidatus Aenigmatarchaeota archaeon]